MDEQELREHYQNNLELIERFNLIKKLSKQINQRQKEMKQHETI